MSHTAAKRTLGICRQASRSTCPCAPAPSRATRTSLEEGLAAEMGVAPKIRPAPAASEEPTRKSLRSNIFPSALGSMRLRSVYLDWGIDFDSVYNRIQKILAYYLNVVSLDMRIDLEIERFKVAWYRVIGHGLFLVK